MLSTRDKAIDIAYTRLPEVGVGSAKFTVEDESFAVVKNGKIVPIVAGETALSICIDNAGTAVAVTVRKAVEIPSIEDHSLSVDEIKALSVSALPVDKYRTYIRFRQSKNISTHYTLK